MAGYKVGYFVGSLATKSINRLLAKALVKLAPPELQMTEISFKDLPLYSYDYDANYPPVATEFKNAIAAVDAVLFVTPVQPVNSGPFEECHRLGQSALRKNAFTRKPSAFIGTSRERLVQRSPSNICAASPFCNSPQMNSIEAYIQFERGLISEDGQVNNESTREFLQNYMAEFHGFIAEFIRCCRATLDDPLPELEGSYPPACRYA